MYSVYRTCTLCKDAHNPNFGVVGKNYESSRIMFILHHSDSRVLSSQLSLSFDHEVSNVDINYSNALHQSDTGRVINWLLKSCRDLRRKTEFNHNLTWDDIYVTNFFKCLLPEDREPKKEEYNSCANVMRSQIISASPRKIVAFGNKTLENMFPKLSLENTLSLNITLYENIPVLLSPHPRRIHDQKDAETLRYLREIRDFIVS